MRLIGHRSVAGAVRWLLGFVNVFVTVAAVAAIALALASWLAPGFANGFLDGLADAPADRQASADLAATLTVTVAAVSVILTWLILNRLRRIFATLTAGDPFRPDNVRWLQTIGFALGGIELAGMLLPLLVPELARAALDIEGPGFDLTAWLGVLVVFILAEVFREGARMRDDTQLTV